MHSLAAQAAYASSNISCAEGGGALDSVVFLAFGGDLILTFFLPGADALESDDADDREVEGGIDDEGSFWLIAEPKVDDVCLLYRCRYTGPGLGYLWLIAPVQGVTQLRLASLACKGRAAAGAGGGD